MRQRLSMMIRWMGVPWREATVAVALIGAAAAPAILVSAADVWRAAAEDDFTMRTVDTMDADELGVSIETTAVMSSPRVAAADAAIRDRLDDVPGLDPPVTSAWTLRERGAAGPDRVNPGVFLRILSRPGAIDAIDVVESDPTIEGGVWISAFVAERTGASVGDVLELDTPSAPDDSGEAETSERRAPSWPIAGIYVPLWSDGDDQPRDPYWDEVPNDLIPSFVEIFREPNFALLLLDEATMRSSGLTGVVQWDAPSADPPTTLADLEARVRSLRSLESDLVQDFQLRSVLGNLAGVDPARSTMTTGLFDAYDEITTSAQRLEEPLAAARTGGVVVGLAVMVAGALFAVQRRRLEYRLLAGDGERWPILSARGALQLAPPVAVGTSIGIVLGAAAGMWFGPADSLRLDVPDIAAVAAVAAVGLVLASLATGLAGQRTLETGTLGRTGGSGALTALLLLLVTASAFLWYQAASIPPAVDDAVDLTVIALPLVALVTAAVIVVAVLSLLLRLGRTAGGHLPTSVFLAWRRMTRNDVANALIIGAVGIGIGLMTLSYVLVGSLDRIADVKLAARVGAETSVELVALPRDPTDLPAASTVVSFDPVRIDPGDRSARIFAIDTDEYAAVVDWPAEFGPPVDDVMRSLSDTDVGDALPVVAVAGSGIPSEGVFGFRDLPYSIIGEVRSAPLVYEHGATLLVDADRLNAYARDRLARRIADRSGQEPSPEEVAALHEPPTDRYRQVIVTRSDEAVVSEWLLERALRTRGTLSRADLEGTIDVLAPRIAFDYLRILGIVAAATALASIALSLSAQRRRRIVASSMTRRMGLAPRVAALATALEVMALLIIAFGTGVLVALAVANRLLPRFDPQPSVPPGPSVTTGPLELALWSLAIVVIVTAGVWLFDRYGAGRHRGGVRSAD